MYQNTNTQLKCKAFMHIIETQKISKYLYTAVNGNAATEP